MNFALLVSLFLQSVFVFASSPEIDFKLSDTNTISTNLFNVSEVSGTSVEIDTFLTEREPLLRRMSFEAPSISNLSLAYVGDRFLLTGTLSYDDITTNFESYGVFYEDSTIDKSVDGANFIVGDMDNFDNINFIQFILSKDRTELVIVLQRIDNGDIMRFEIPSVGDLFNVLFDMIENPVEGIELIDKLSSLRSLTSSLLEPVELLTSSHDFSSEDVSDPYVNMRRTRNNWRIFIDDLNRRGSVRLSDYRNMINTSFLQPQVIILIDSGALSLMKFLPQQD